MVSLLWAAGLARRRPARLLATAAGIAVAVALTASIAAFLSHARATMTQAATHQVFVDWQVEGRGDPSAVLATVRSERGVQAALTVGFADVPSLRASTGGTVQTTGAAVVVGVPDGYLTTFPGEIRVLAGTTDGALLAQQTASNLHAAPGDTIVINRSDGSAVNAVVHGIVELPQADTLFQKVGAAAGAQASAPPDNVVVLPAGLWHRAFDTSPHRFQAHVRIDHRLPHDPAAAFAQVAASARHLELALAGGGVVGDNIGAALDAARGDAAYAQILFLLLGLPGVVLAGLLTATLVAADADRRRRHLSLLRIRGATVRTMIGIAVVEAAVVAFVGAVVGLGGALVIGRTEFGSATFGASTLSSLLWGAGSFGSGVVVAGLALVVPTWRDARRLTVVAARQVVGPARRPWWLRAGLDAILLGASGVVWWLTSRGGYRVVLVPEGLPTLSVNYAALAAPLLFWAGSGLLAYRLADGLFGRGSRAIAAAGRPLGGGLHGLVASSFTRHRHRLARPVAVIALAVAFAASTAVFNTTYGQQAAVDARLTNGADITVMFPSSAPAGVQQAKTLAAVPGVRHVEPLLHRYAYVGNDLQDLYGVRPGTVVGAARLQDAYFTGGSARGLIARLARQPDGVLVSAETARDFQLTIGDPLHLRIRDGRTGQPKDVTFHYVGIGKEFPTAPRDSFLVANADYLAAQTGNGGVETFLLDAHSPAAVAQRVRTHIGGAASVTDLVTSRRQVGSALTAVDLAGLTRVELAFALVFAAAATGLVLALGAGQRRRSSAIARALGAGPRQVSAFVRMEAASVTASGLVLGAAAGWMLAVLLVKILTGVFDPAPAALAVPWRYLATVAGLAIAAAVVAGELTIRAGRRPIAETMRDL